MRGDPNYVTPPSGYDSEIESTEEVRGAGVGCDEMRCGGEAALKIITTVRRGLHSALSKHTHYICAGHAYHDWGLGDFDNEHQPG